LAGLPFARLSAAVCKPQREILIPLFGRRSVPWSVLLVGQFYWQVWHLGLVEGPHPGWFCWKVQRPRFIQGLEFIFGVFQGLVVFSKHGVYTKHIRGVNGFLPPPE